MARRKPFADDDRGYRDALIWESILQLAEESDTPIALITGTSRDFAGPDSGLHADLVQDLLERGLHEHCVELYIDLGAFNRRNVEPALHELEGVREAIAAGTYLGEPLDALLLRQLESLTEWPEVYPSQLGLPEEVEDLLLVAVEDVSDVEISHVRRLSTEELLVGVAAELTCDFEFVVPTGGEYAQEYGLDWVPDTAWEPDTVRVRTDRSKQVRADLDMTLSSSTREVTSLRISSLSPSRSVAITAIACGPRVRTYVEFAVVDGIPVGVPKELLEAGVVEALGKRRRSVRARVRVRDS